MDVYGLRRASKGDTVFAVATGGRDDFVADGALLDSMAR